MTATPSWTKWTESAGELSPRVSVPLVLGLLLVAAAADWATGPELASALFYLPAIFAATWTAGRRIGLATAVASGLIWLAMVLLTNRRYTHEYVPFWNALVRTCTFCLLSLLLSEVLGRKRAEARLEKTNTTLQAQTHILQSILDSMGDGVVVTDAQGRLIHMNPAARRALRAPAGENDEAFWSGFQKRYVPQEPPDPFSRATRGEVVDGEELFVQHPNFPAGAWLAVSGRPLRGEAETRGGVVVFSDITARKNLERQISEVSEREQRRLGEDLHDGLCQHLLSVAFAARGLSARLQELARAEADDAAEIAELLSESINQARDVARGLCLVPAEAGGLASALEEFTLRVAAQHRLPCEFIENSPVPALEEALGTNLFRIAQEAVTNAIKHAEPRHITVSLSADPRQITLAVEDDGVGFKSGAESAHGLGLHIMQHRARLVGASLHIEPRSGGGTRVLCSLRLPGAAQQPATSDSAAAVP